LVDRVVTRFLIPGGRLIFSIYMPRPTGASP